MVPKFITKGRGAGRKVIPIKVKAMPPVAVDIKDRYVARFVGQIEDADHDYNVLSRIVNKIYEDGFQDGSDEGQA